MKKFFSALMVTLLLMPSVAFSASFADTQGHWAESTIYNLADRGIINGVTADTFCPDNNVTRAEFLKLAMECE